MRFSRSRLTLISALLVIAPACGRLPPMHYYVLELPDEASGSAQSGEKGLIIGVETFQVDPPYDQDRIVYRVGENSVEVGFYAYHRWAVPLSRMLPKVVASGLQGAAGVKSIEPLVPSQDYTALLEGRVLSFEQIDTSEGQRIHVRITLVLRLQDGTELWMNILDGDATMETDHVSDLVDQMCHVLGQALNNAREGLGRTLHGNNAGLDGRGGRK